MELIEETPYRFRIERSGDMRVPGVIFASRALLPEADGDQSVEQVANVATLPGIVDASYAMPNCTGATGFRSVGSPPPRCATAAWYHPARSVSGQVLRDDLERQGIAVRGASRRGLAEKAPTAYKDVSAVVAAAEGAGLCRTVARLVPLGVVKG